MNVDPYPPASGEPSANSGAPAAAGMVMTPR